MAPLPPAPRPALQQQLHKPLPGAPTPPAQYYSPLNTNKSVVHVQLSEACRSSMQLSDGGGDTRAPTASDQRVTVLRDKPGVGGDPLIAQVGRQAGTMGVSEVGSQHTLCGCCSLGIACVCARHAQALAAQRQHSARAQAAAGWVGGTAAAAAAAAGGGTSGQAIVPPPPPVGIQLPQEISSSLLDDCVLQPEESSPFAAAGPRSSSHGGGASSHLVTQRQSSEAASGPRSHALLPQPAAEAEALAVVGAAEPDQSSGGGNAVGADAGGQGTGSRSGTPAAASSDDAAAAAAAAVSPPELEDSYDEDDLDDDWRHLLGGVDARLRLQGARRMNARERAVAIKRLLLATHTRGVEFVLDAALQEVLSFRRVHGE
jgi:hypothetical protein